MYIGDTIVYAGATCEYTQLSSGLDPVFTDACPFEEGLSHDYLFAPSEKTLAGASFPVGSTLVNWILTDAAGNAVSCSYTITVLDTIAPAFINCPTDTLIIGTDVDNCTAFVNFSTPIAADNCEVTVSQITGPGSGSTLDPGFYTVQFLAEDGSGNTDTCAFVIHVNDTQVPTIACPSNTSLYQRMQVFAHGQVRPDQLLQRQRWVIVRLQLRMKLPERQRQREQMMQVEKCSTWAQARFVIQSPKQWMQTVMAFRHQHVALL